MFAILGLQWPTIAQVGPTWALLGLSWPTWAHFGLFLGPSWAYLGSLLGLSWAILGLAWALFAYLGSLLGLSWPIFGRSWALLGPLGPSWASLGHLFNMSSILLQCPTTFNLLSQAPPRTRFPFHARTGLQRAPDEGYLDVLYKIVLRCRARGS